MGGVPKPLFLQMERTLTTCMVALTTPTGAKILTAMVRKFAHMTQKATMDMILSTLMLIPAPIALMRNLMFAPLNVLTWPQTQTTAVHVVMHVELMHIVPVVLVNVIADMETAMVIGLTAVKPT